MSKTITYKDAVAFELSERGRYSDLNYTPVFKASALFAVIVDSKINTHISFMNYWKEKNKNESVSALVTLRNSEGEKVLRDFYSLREMVYQFDVRKMLGERGSGRFVGSFEVEFFSNQDLKYAFPALEVFYESPAGISFVHSNQRVFQSIEDMDKSATLNAWQTGFDVYADERRSGYLTVVNGPREVKDSRAHLKIYNQRGDLLEEVIRLGTLSAYASRFILLSERPSLRTFLGGQPGFLKAQIDTFGVFLRVACGNISADSSVMTVTHSYYDLNKHEDYYDKKEISGKEHFCFLPFNLLSNSGIEVEHIFYPIYCPSKLSFSLDLYSKEGALKERLENFERLDATGGKMLRVNIKEILRRHQLPSSDYPFGVLHVDSQDGRIPARLTFGLNYYKEGQIGSNINSSVLMNKGHGERKRIYLWGPLMCREASQNLILISHFSKIKNSAEKASLQLKIFDRKGMVAQEEYETKNNTALNLDVNEILSKVGYRAQHNQVLWYTVESESPNYIANHLHISPAGFIGGDHSF